MAAENNDLAAYCFPDFGKCGAAVGDLVPHLMEGIEYFKSMAWLDGESTGTKTFQQDPCFKCWHNVNLCVGMCCLPCCNLAVEARTYEKVTGKSCETICLSSCLLNCVCCCGVCYMLKVRRSQGFQNCLSRGRS